MINPAEAQKKNRLQATHVLYTARGLDQLQINTEEKHLDQLYRNIEINRRDKLHVKHTEVNRLCQFHGNTVVNRLYQHT